MSQPQVRLKYSGFSEPTELQAFVLSEVFQAASAGGGMSSGMHTIIENGRRMNFLTISGPRHEFRELMKNEAFPADAKTLAEKALALRDEYDSRSPLHRFFTSGYVEERSFEDGRKLKLTISVR